MVMFGVPATAELCDPQYALVHFLQTVRHDNVLEMERIRHLNTDLGIEDPIDIARNNSVFQAQQQAKTAKKSTVNKRCCTSSLAQFVEAAVSTRHARKQTRRCVDIINQNQNQNRFYCHQNPRVLFSTQKIIQQIMVYCSDKRYV